MIHYLFALIIFLHGVVHLVGYSKAFRYSELKNITVPISKPVGILWIVTCVLFIITSILYLLHTDYWWMAGLIAVIMSQIVIMLAWKDAKFGTLANLLILVLVLVYLFKKYV